MTETLTRDDNTKVYEIGYLIVSSVPEEKVPALADSLQELLFKKEANILASETPELRRLAYTMVKKIGSKNHSFDRGYFGWFKFEVKTSEIESIKKDFELNPDILRVLLISTVRENTYLGKRMPADISISSPVVGEEQTSEQAPSNPQTETETTQTSSIEEMDKSIDEMVKEA